MPLEIVWIRHGHSCGNAKYFSHHPKLYRDLFLKTKNPALSNLAWAQLEEVQTAVRVGNKRQKLKTFLNSIDVWCCSDLLRAMETCYLLKNSVRSGRKKDICVLPYVNEVPKSRWLIKFKLDQENQTQGPTESIQRLKELRYDTTQFNYNLYVKLTQGKLHYPNLKTFCQKVLLDTWFATNNNKRRGKKTLVRMAIVSHGNFLQEFIQQTRSKDIFYHQQPLYRPLQCRHRISEDEKHESLSNLSMFRIRLNQRQVQDYVDDSIRHPLPSVKSIYNPDTVMFQGQCYRLTDKKNVTSTEANSKMVTRCPYNIRKIFF